MLPRWTELLLAEVFGFVPKPQVPDIASLGDPVDVTEHYRSEMGHAIDRIWVAFDYASISDLLKRWKYERDEDAWMAIEPGFHHVVSKLSKMSEWPPQACLVPMPIGLDRLAERRFNQAACLAGSVSAVSGFREFRWMYRFWSGRHQARLARKERLRRSVSFWIPRTIRVPKRVILVDDVISTGTTLYAAARYLKRRGCESVTVLALARSAN